MIKKIKQYLDSCTLSTPWTGIDYKSYWQAEPHCKKSKPITQIDGNVVYVCTHKVEIN